MKEMGKFKCLAILLPRGIFTLILLLSGTAFAGYFELSANGSYYRYNNGSFDGELSTTTVRRLGAGLGYNFLSNTSVELQYTNSLNLSKYTQQEEGDPRRYRLRRTEEFHNIALNLVLHLTAKGNAFRPYVMGGAGYMIRKTSLKGTLYDTDLLDETTLNFRESDPEKSISANGGFGLKMYVAQAIALELSFSLFATDLDAEQVYLHYAAAGGLRYLF